MHPSATPRTVFERCACGAERKPKEKFCETCSPSTDSDTRLAAAIGQRWLDMGAPDQGEYARRFGCNCHCHKAKALARAGKLEGELVQVARHLPCVCPGAPLSVSVPLPEGTPWRLEKTRLDAATEADERKEDPLECQAIKTRRALTSLDSKPILGRLGKPIPAPGILPPLEPINPPEGPARWAPISRCLCDCHQETEPCPCECHAPECCMTDDGRSKHEARALVFQGCKCREHDSQACSSRKAQKSTGGRCGHWREDPVTGATRWERAEQPCAKPGPGIRRPKQQPHTAERKAQRVCAIATPPPPTIPAACHCGCHVTKCCTDKSGERHKHSERGTLFGACSCEEHDAGACSLAKGGPRVLAVKVDTLHLSWHVELDPAFIEMLKKKLQESREGSREFVTVKLPGCGETPWRVMPQGAGRWMSFRLTNEYADLLVSTIRKAEAAQLRFEVRSAFLWERELEGAWAWCAEIAHALHQGKRCARSGLTRIDMAVDVTGVDMEHANREDFVSRARKRTIHYGRHTTGDDCPSCIGSGNCMTCHGAGKLSDGHGEPDLTVGDHASGLKPSGHSFGHGGIVARIYDKTREIKEKSKDKKWLYLCWAARGWVDTETVWRVEIQIRRETLKEFLSERTLSTLSLDTIKGLRDALASLWSYSVGGRNGHAAWFKWSIPSEEDTRRSRWEVRPEWKVIQAADWGRVEAFPLVRHWVKTARFNAILPPVVGCLRLMAADAGKVTEEQDGHYTKKVEREPIAADFQRHIDAYVLRRFKRPKRSDGEVVDAGVLWAEAINDKRIERGLEGAVPRTTTDVDRILVAQAERVRAKKAKRQEHLVAMSL